MIWQIVNSALSAVNAVAHTTDLCAGQLLATRKLASAQLLCHISNIWSFYCCCCRCLFRIAGIPQPLHLRSANGPNHSAPEQQCDKLEQLGAGVL